MFKKLICTILTVCMLLSCVPALALDSSEKVQSLSSEPANYTDDVADFDSMFEISFDEPDLFKPFSENEEVESHWWYDLPKNANIDAHDREKLLAFMECTDTNGKKNGEQINESYSKDDPRTWGCVLWEKYDGIYYLAHLYFSSSVMNSMTGGFPGMPQTPTLSLAGKLDLSGCKYLQVLNCHKFNGSDSCRYDSVDISNCPRLNNVDFKGSKLNFLNVKGSNAIEQMELENVGLESLDISGLAVISHLSCADNPIKDLKVDGCTGLQYLDIRNCRVSYIDLSTLPSIETIIASGNEFASLDSFDVVKDRLQSLNISENPILDMLDISEYSALKSIYCNNCGLREIFLPNNSQDLRVQANGNMLTKLDLQSAVGLTGLSVNSNYLTELDLSNCAKLGGVTCANNFLKEIKLPASGVEFTTIRCENNLLSELNIPDSCAYMRRIDCQNNYIKELDVSKFMYLGYLDCRNNLIEKLNLSEQVAIPREEGISPFKCFFCIGNPLKEVNYVPVKYEGEEVRLSVKAQGGGYTAFNSDMTSGSWRIYLIAEPVQGQSFQGWYDGSTLVSSETKIDITKLNKFNLTGRFSGALPSAFTQKHDEFDFTRPVFTLTVPSGVEFNASDLEKAVAFLEAKGTDGKTNGEKLMQGYSKEEPEKWNFLKWDEIDGELRITEIYFDADISNKDFTYVEADNRYKLEGILDFSGMDKLVAVFADCCGVTEASFENCTSLKYIAMHENAELSQINIKGCAVLRFLDLEACNLSNIDISGASHLGWLDISHNKLSKLENVEKTGIVTLYCGYNEFTSIDASKATELAVLGCEGNKITKLDVEKCKNLCVLYCMDNGMTELKAAGAKLAMLDCSNNKLKSAVVSSSLIVGHYDNNEITSFGVQEISSQELRVFTCAKNKLKQIRFRNCRMLDHIDVSSNQIESFSFPQDDYEWTGPISYLDCSNNKIKELVIPTSKGLHVLNYFDCSNNEIEALDLRQTGANMYYLNISGNAIKSIKKAPMRYITEQPIAWGSAADKRLNVTVVNGKCAIDYDLDTLTVTTTDEAYFGIYDGNSKLLTKEKTLAVKDLESTDLYVCFGLRGDANLDGKVDTGDAVTVLKYSAEMIILSVPQMATANMNGDDKVNTADAVQILKFAAGMIS